MKAQVQTPRTCIGRLLGWSSAKKQSHPFLKQHRKHKLLTYFKSEATEYPFLLLLSSHSFSPKEKENDFCLVSITKVLAIAFHQFLDPSRALYILFHLNVVSVYILVLPNQNLGNQVCLPILITKQISRKRGNLPFDSPLGNLPPLTLH